MSSDTINKVQHTVLPTPQPATVSFLKAAVGFSRNDCATQLGRHEGGIHFLGLAAALVTSLGAFESAKSLAVMLKRTTDDDLTMMPSVLHLKDLLSSLEARSHRCGFAESVVGWQILLRKAVLPSVFSDETRRRLTQKSLDRLETELLKSTPSPEALAGLVDAFRQSCSNGSRHSTWGNNQGWCSCSLGLGVRAVVRGTTVVICRRQSSSRTTRVPAQYHHFWCGR
jgi:hypothetical protein